MCRIDSENPSKHLLLKNNLILRLHKEKEIHLYT